MSFNIDEVVKGMSGAIGGILSNDFPKVKECVENALNEEKQAISDIAKARIDGKINDDELKSQLDDERETLNDVLLACQVRAKKMIQDSANAAINVLEDAIKAAIKIA